MDEGYQQMDEGYTEGSGRHRAMHPWVTNTPLSSQADFKKLEKNMNEN